MCCRDKSCSETSVRFVVFVAPSPRDADAQRAQHKSKTSGLAKQHENRGEGGNEHNTGASEEHSQPSVVARSHTQACVGVNDESAVCPARKTQRRMKGCGGVCECRGGSQKKKKERKRRRSKIKAVLRSAVSPFSQSESLMRAGTHTSACLVCHEGHHYLRGSEISHR